MVGMRDVVQGVAVKVLCHCYLYDSERSPEGMMEGAILKKKCLYSRIGYIEIGVKNEDNDL
jgi:hypothetical protein